MAISRLYFYQGAQPSRVLSDQVPFTFFRNEAIPLAESGRFNNVSGTLFILSDGNNSVLNTLSGGSVSYTPFGYASRKQGELFSQAFNGQIHIPLALHYLLGNGRRAYSTVLMRFCSADTDSPFASGGINAYAYCGADPVNYSDPSARTRVKSKSSVQVPRPSPYTRQPHDSRPHTRSQSKTISTNEALDLAQQFINDESKRINIDTISTSEVEKFFKGIRKTPDHPWIKQQPEKLRPSAGERNTLETWAMSEGGIRPSDINAWLDAQTLELDPVHTLLETPGYDLTAAKKANKTISKKIHKIRHGY